MLVLSWQNTEFVFASKKEILPLKQIVTYDYNILPTHIFQTVFFAYTDSLTFVTFWTNL